MILKPIDLAPQRATSGRPATAERQMALPPARFASGLFVLNNLRIVDPDQPEFDGCQRLPDRPPRRTAGGIFIVEQSVTDESPSAPTATAATRWTRRFRGREQGIESPIQQARRQGEFLRAMLSRHHETLRSRLPVGLRTAKKVLAGTEYAGYRFMPIQIVVAISDTGKICRINEWHERTKPFCDFVVKADLVGGKILSEFKRHRSAASLLSTSLGD